MSQNAQITTTIQLAGLTFAGQATRTGDVATAMTPALPAGFAGALTTRTLATSGVITLTDTGHGLTDADTIDVYWTGGSARDGTISLVNEAVVTFAGLVGDALPAEASAVIVGKRVAVDVDFAGNTLEALAAVCPRRATAVFAADAGTEQLVLNLAANEPYVWVSDSGPTNPLAGDAVGQLIASCGETSAAVLTAAVLRDATA